MENTLYIPIPHYPPFKLRSSLIDKDPVIWAHLLEGYIKLCSILLTGDVRLDVKSQQQFHLFLKVWLAETSEEANKILSLGAINPDIKNNTASLRAYVFQIICDYGVVKLGLSGESLWNFVMIYVEKNASLVRAVLAGSHKSKFNDNKKSGKISLIPVLRKHLLSMVTLGKMQKMHLEILTLLLGQHISAPTSKTLHVTGAGKSQNTGKTLARDKYKQSSTGALQFAENFVTEDWIEELELMYVDGKSVHAEIIKSLMVISILSLSVSKLAKVISTIGIHGGETLILAPLLSTVILSEPYRKLNPGLEERLPFLRNISYVTDCSIANPDIEFLLEMFPNLTQRKAMKLLSRYENNIDQTTNALLENVALIEEISDDDTEQNSKSPVISKTELEKGLNRFKLSSHETTERFKKKTGKSSLEIKKNTLTAALRLLYDSDEDERDDTYDDQEHTTGSAFTETDNRSRVRDKISVVDDEGDDGMLRPSSKLARTSVSSEFDPNEVLLFGFLKTGGDSLFDKGNRKSGQRKDMKAKTGWTDEQIEGWSRMLQRSSKRFRLLEEYYVFHNSNRRVQKDQRAQKDESDSTRSSSIKTTPNINSEKKSSDKNTQKRNEANKAKKANHSRKSGHSKKTRSELAGMQ
ncbi:hypothetical protein METBIDRAFT_32948 [Metschnikowia bicuspidata var. bicuspidata NRRL YB-4993]|uniref:CUE domain-containing protein n=1 Tax=Metschnikowia bicuspidata var. bicuspidata NRRL YB-4993 TaxID=869754 RepID=A0A1A0H7G9_9ASCO|nr:hypothetical protein METBIDRAFT_32948 [Metschnikowia bicuspidata var. bicuspidata NRRL YB-4993]OBA19925.1 hypothetical protein METBIDRAFT_32948 [Metschnikowia bicuspidata var. bicuspidata NRRL YB-4993]